jgi:TonB family protein
LNGAVILECVIGVDGSVRSVTVVKGFRSLAKAAEKAVRRWRYTPTMLRGTAVPAIMTVTVNFKLRAPPKRAGVMASLNDADPEVRWAAILWLARYRPITAAQQAAVKGALKDPDEQVRTAAQDAQAKLGAN